jgi:hypothetical protein
MNQEPEKLLLGPWLNITELYLTPLLVLKITWLKNQNNIVILLDFSVNKCKIILNPKKDYVILARFFLIVLIVYYMIKCNCDFIL